MAHRVSKIVPRSAEIGRVYATCEHNNEKPILLLDDLFDKLDMGRVAQLLRLVGSEMFGQIFITDCNKHRLQRTLSEAGAEYKLFTIAEGKHHE